MSEGAEQDDKTEDPSDRRLEKSVERGEVARSADLSAFLSLALAGGAAFAMASFGADAMRSALEGLLSNAGQTTAGAATTAALRAAVLVVAAPLLAGFLGALAGGFVMHRPVLALEPLMPKGERISPLAGWKRIFGAENLVQFVKTAAKIMLAAGVLVLLWRSDGWRLPLAELLSDPNALSGTLLTITGRVFFSLLALFAVFGGLDAAYQRFAWRKRLRMSHQEVKDEHKETEGSPEIKQRVRSLQRQRARQRMMASVPTATVVIANPTHFAVALRYEKGMAAPVCVAKGVDELALRIRSVASEHRVPVVENPPLARALHATVKVDEEIPVEHYKAVAQVIGAVLRVARRR